MKKNKPGFTLSEVLITTVIIGVIMALSVKALSTVRASYPSLTYFAFNNVNQMVAITSKLSSPEPKLKDINNYELPYLMGKCFYNRKLINVIKSDVEYDSNINAVKCTDRATITGTKQNLFCKSLAAISNTSGSVDCTNLSTVQKVGNQLSIVINNYDVPNFITTNGQRYYISEWQYDDTISPIYGYRIIAVDLNGKSRPNSLTSKNPPADIVQFLVFDNSEIFPLGYAADNLTLGPNRNVRYITAKVKGYYMSDKPDRTDNVSPSCYKTISGTRTQICNYGVVYIQNENAPHTGSSIPTSFTYRQAYCAAFGSNRDMFYSDYCTSVPVYSLCPPSTEPQAFDICKPENIKPSFRYNL